MLCACSSGEQFKFEKEAARAVPPPPQSPESLATRDFSASCISSTRTVPGDWESKLDDVRVDEAESTLKEALSLNYEEARALLGRLEYQKGNFEAALHVFQGIDIRSLNQKMAKAIAERIRLRKVRAKGDITVSPSVMSMHSVSLLLEAILLKAKSLGELGSYAEAAKECKVILDIVESALPDGMPEGIGEDCKLEEMFHKALELLPVLWTKAGELEEAINAYRRALVKPWNLTAQRLEKVQKDLALMLLYGAIEARIPPHLQIYGSTTPRSNLEEAILLLLVLMSKVAYGEIKRDEEIMHHLTYALSISGQFTLLAEHVEQALPGVFSRAERWYLLALCYTAAGQNEAGLNLLKKVYGRSESKSEPHVPSFLMGAKLCSQDPKHAHEGINFAYKVIESVNPQNQHVISQAHKYIGVCYGDAARKSVSDSERTILLKESLNSLSSAALTGNQDPQVIYNLALENLQQRNVDAALEDATRYAEMVAGYSVNGWKLLALVVSAEQRFKDAETVIEFALDEGGRIDQFELLRLKALLQIAQEQPKRAIETYRVLLSLIQSHREIHAKNLDNARILYFEAEQERNLELAAWLDLATIYTKLGLLADARICADKAKLMELFSPRLWHTTGTMFQAQSLNREALVSFSISLGIEPDYVPSIISTAQVLMKLGRPSFPIARSFLMNALRLDPKNHVAWFNLGLISKMEGSLQQAADFLQAAYELKQSAPVELPS